MIFRNLAIISCVLYAALIAWGAHAESFKKGDFVLRGKVAVIDPDESGSFINLGGEPHISTSVIPSVDLTYFITDNIAIEAIPGLIPHRTKARNTSQGTRDGGWVYAVAPTVLIQYHHQEAGKLYPYLGAGVAYVKFFEDDTTDQLQYSDDIAYLIQAGVNYQLDDKWHANVDLKKVWLDTTVKANGGADYIDARINPMVYSVGVGYKF